MMRRRRIAAVLCALTVHSTAAMSQELAEQPSELNPPRSSVLDDHTSHVAFSVDAGQLGQEPIYNLRLAFFPIHRLGLEATLAHNPASGVHAALHHFGALVPVGTLWRLRPFAAAGIGTIQVFPGTSVNADTVTRLSLATGGGAHFFVRDDVALRFEGRSFVVLDQQEEDRGTLRFTQWSVGLTFYRALVASGSREMGETR
jgi:hypothetical protein